VRERQRTERIRTQALSYSSRVTSKARGCHGDSAGLGKGCTYLGECGDGVGVANIQTQRQERVWVSNKGEEAQEQKSY